MASILDLTKVQDAHIDQRLRTNLIIWLNTVRPDGRPHGVAVWFLWDGAAFWIFSRPHNQKIRNLQQNRNVLLAVDDTYKGDDPIAIEGEATLLAPGEIEMPYPPYLEKYSEYMQEVGLTPEQLATHSQAIRIKPTRVLRQEAKDADSH